MEEAAGPPPQQKLEEIKIALIGDSGVGKSSIVQRFSSNSFSELHKPTNGLEQISKFVTAPNLKKLKLDILDVTAKNFFDNRLGEWLKNCVVIIVFDVSNRESFWRVLKWFEIAEQSRGANKFNLPIFLVANKIDLERQIQTKEATDFARQLGMRYVELSAKNSIDVEKPFEMIAQAAAGENSAGSNANSSNSNSNSSNSNPNSSNANSSNSSNSNEPPKEIDDETLLGCLRDGMAQCRYVKVVFGGEGRAGKTSTQRSLLGKNFNSSTVATNGIQITTAVLSEKGFREDENTDFVKQGILDALAENSKKSSKNICNDNEINKTAKNDSEEEITNLKLKFEKQIAEDEFEENGKFSSTMIAETGEMFQELSSQVEDCSVPSYLGKLKLDDDVREAVDGNAPDSMVALFYDCGGQNIYQTANELFFTPRSVVVVVFDLQAVLQSGNVAVLKSWCNNISLHSPDSPIILVGSHSDKVNNPQDHQGISDMIRTQLSAVFAWSRVVNRHHSVVFVPVDNTRGSESEGIVELRKLILKVSREQPFFKEQFPVRWLQCLDATIKFTESPILSMDQYKKKIAARFGIESDEELTTMCKQFHELGFIAFYNDSKLSDCVITNPQRVIDAISAVITSKHQLHLAQVRSSEMLNRYLETGEISRSLLNDLLVTADFTQPFHQGVVLSLLQRFDFVCEMISDSLDYEQQHQDPETLFLVPSMLPDKSDETNLNSSSNNNNNIARIYLSDINGTTVFPPGVYHRLVCKCLRWSQLTSSFPRTFTFRSAVLAFGKQLVKLSWQDDKQPHIKLIISTQQAAATMDLIEMLLREVCGESFPHISVRVEVEGRHEGQIFVRDVADVRTCVKEGRPILDKVDHKYIELPHEVFSAWITETQDSIYDAFLSYRVSTDSTRARLMFDCLAVQTVRADGSAPRVFLDKKCLLVGHQWDLEFARALSRSAVFVAIISEESFGMMLERATMSTYPATADNVLLEWELACELLRFGCVKAIVPLFTSSSLFGSLKLPDVVNHETNSRCVSFLTQLGFKLTEEDRTRILNQSLSTVAAKLGSFQALAVDRFSRKLAAGASQSTDWGMHMKCAVMLAQLIRKECVDEKPTQQQQQQQQQQQTMQADNTQEQAELQRVLQMHDLGEWFEALVKQNCSTYTILMSLSASQVRLLMDDIGMTGTLLRQRFAELVQREQLQQSLDSWLNQVQMGKYSQAFKEIGCNSFEVLFGAQEAGSLEELLDEVGISGWSKKTFVSLVAKQRERMLN